MLTTPVNEHNGYYAPTAFDSTKPRWLASADNSKLGFMMRTFRRNMIPNHGSAQCCEFFSQYYQAGLIEDLNSDRKEVLDYLNEPMHERLTWQSYRNPRALVEVASKVVLIFAACAWCWFIVYCGMAVFARPDWFLTYDFPIFFFQIAAPSLVYLTGKYLLAKNLVKDKNNIYLYRRKGTVLIPGKKGRVRELPFDEFDGYIGSTVNPSGSEDYHLILAHRYTASFVQQPDGGDEPWKVCADWEQLLQYMDISKPLPDIPSMEPFRHQDPMTAEYDRKFGRPKDYWKNLDMKVAEQYNDASRKAAKQYPWDLTREQALSAGWQPSGVGEGDWQQRETEPMPHTKGL